MLRHKSQLDTIQLVVAEAFGLPFDEMTLNTNTRSVVIPRQIAMYLAKQLTDASVLEIGRHFGRNYKTVMYAVAKVEDQRRASTEVSAMVNKLLAAIAGGPTPTTC